MAAKKKTSTFLDNLVPFTKDKEEFEQRMKKEKEGLKL